MSVRAFTISCALIVSAFVALLAGITNAPQSIGQSVYRMAPCVTEDSGPNPCFWDATTRGNGLGTSFILYNGTQFDRYEGTQKGD